DELEALGANLGGSRNPVERDRAAPALGGGEREEAGVGAEVQGRAAPVGEPCEAEGPLDRAIAGERRLSVGGQPSGRAHGDASRDRERTGACRTEALRKAGRA